MKALNRILLACLVLTALRWAVAAMTAAIMLGLTVALIRSPAKTLAVLFGWLLLCAFAARPTLGLVLFILLVLGGSLRKP